MFAVGSEIFHECDKMTLFVMPDPFVDVDAHHAAIFVSEACRAFAERQIELVKPEVIVVLGAVPLRFLFPKVFGGIRMLRGKWMDYKGIRVMPTYHPAYLLRNASAKADAWHDLQQVMAVFGKTPRRRGQ